MTLNESESETKLEFSDRTHEIERFQDGLIAQLVRAHA